MKPTLPPEFVAWVRAYVLSAQFTTVRRLHRGLILRWGFWLDGIPQNALPGYTTPPKPGPNGLPLGWSFHAFNDIAREAIGTTRIHTARKRAASSPRIHDCGSGHPYGTCTVCGQGHGYVVKSSSQPSTLSSQLS